MVENNKMQSQNLAKGTIREHENIKVQCGKITTRLAILKNKYSYVLDHSYNVLDHTLDRAT